jgi:asparagine synthase (glutamine-hydrolysing)
MRFGFCFASDADGARFYLSGPPALGRFLSSARVESTTAVILGRLHYRGDLISRLMDRQRPADNASDASYVLAAYHQWGRDGLNRLEGCFALAVWDGAKRHVYARRDLLGGFPLYWAVQGRRAAVGTSLDQVRDWTGSGEMDPDYEAEYLMLRSCGENEVASERTPYRGVQRLLPQTILDADLEAGRASVLRHWDWLDEMEDPGSTELPAVAARYGELLRDAVRERMSGLTAAHVSGGLDSTSVALLAAEEIRKGDAVGPLHTISLVYDSMSVLSREREVINSAVKDNPLLVPHFIAGDALLDFEPYFTPPDHEEPWPWLGAAGTERARTDAAIKAGVRTVLTGQGADEFLDLGPYHITDLLRRGRFFRAWRAASAAAHGENCGIWPILYPFGVRNLLPTSLRDGFSPLLTGGQTGWLRMGEFTLPPWIRADYAKRHSLRDRLRAQARRFLARGTPHLLSVALEKIASRAGDLGRWYLSAPQGVLVEHPFLDPRLICFLLGVHARMAPQPRAISKPILVEAMKGILPDPIRLRSKAGFFNEPYFRGIACYANELERELCTDRQVIPDWLDAGALAHCLRQSALGIGTDRVQMDRLNVTLSWLKWLSLRRRTRAIGDDTPAGHRPRQASVA